MDFLNYLPYHNTTPTKQSSAVEPGKVNDTTDGSHFLRKIELGENYRSEVPSGRCDCSEVTWESFGPEAASDYLTDNIQFWLDLKKSFPLFQFHVDVPRYPTHLFAAGRHWVFDHDRDFCGDVFQTLEEAVIEYLWSYKETLYPRTRCTECGHFVLDISVHECPKDDVDAPRCEFCNEPYVNRRKCGHTMLLHIDRKLTIEPNFFGGKRVGDVYITRYFYRGNCLRMDKWYDRFARHQGKQGTVCKKTVTEQGHEILIDQPQGLLYLTKERRRRKVNGILSRKARKYRPYKFSRAFKPVSTLDIGFDESATHEGVGDALEAVKESIAQAFQMPGTINSTISKLGGTFDGFTALLGKIEEIFHSFGCKVSLAKKVATLTLCLLSIIQNPSKLNIASQVGILFLNCELTTSADAFLNWYRGRSDPVQSVLHGPPLLACHEGFDIVTTMRSLGVILVGLLSLLSVGSLPDISMNSLATLGRTLTGVTCLGVAIEKVSNWVSTQFDPPQELKDWIHAATYVEGIDDNAFLMDVDLVDAVVKFGRRTKDWYPTIVQRYKGNTTQLGIITRLYEKVVAKYALAIRSPLNTAVTRQEPTTIYIYGEAGVGKTYCTKLLQRALLRSNTRLLESERSALTDHVFSRKCANTYWDGYHGQFICQYDDMLQIKDTESRPNPEILEVIHAVNCEPYQLHMADIKDKKDCFFKSKIIIATTNTKQPTTRSCHSIAAFNRRWDLAFELRNPPEYQKDLNNKKVFKPIEGKAPDDTDGYEFYPLNLAEGRTTGPAKTFDEVLMQMNILYETKTEKYGDLMDLHAAQFKERSINLEEGSEPLMRIITNDAIFQGDDDDSVCGQDDDDYEPEEDMLSCQSLSDNRLRQAFEALEEDTTYDEVATNEDYEETCRILEEEEEAINPVGIKEKIMAAVTALGGPKKILMTAALISRVVKAPGCLTFLWEDWLQEKMNKAISEKLPQRFANWAKVYGNIIFALCEFLLSMSLLEVLSAEELFSLHGLTATTYVLYRLQAAFMHITQPGDLVMRMHRHAIYNSLDWMNMGVAKRIASLVALVISGRFPYKEQIKKKANEYFVSLGHAVKDAVSGVITWTSEHPAITAVLTLLAALGGFFALRGAVSTDLAQATMMSGDHITQRVKKARQEQLGTHEGLSDPNAIDLANKLFSRNYATISCSSYKVNAIAIKGNTFLVPYHFIEVARNKNENADIPIMLSQPHLDFGVEVSLKDCRWKQLTRKNGSLIDAAFITSDAFPMRPDAVKYFLNDELTLRAPFILTNRGGDKTFLSFSQSHVRELPQGVESYVDGKRIFNQIHGALEYTCPTIPGDCGALIFDQNTTNATKICGIHVAAHGNGIGFAEVLSQPLLQRCLEDFHTLSLEIPEIKHTDRIVEGDAVTYGTINPSPANAPSDTDIVPSRIQEHYEHTPTTKPAFLRPVRVAGQKLDPAEIAISKVTKSQPEVNMTLVEESLGDIFSRIKHNKRRVLTHAESILGVEYLNPVNRTTSAGYPWNLQTGHGKKPWLGECEDWNLEHPDLFEDCERIIAKAEAGIRVPTMFTASLKDERRPIAKVNKGKTRVFEMSNMTFTLVFRRYFGDFMAALTEQKIENEISVGTNPYSSDWDRIYRRVMSKGGKIIAGDFSDYDGSQLLIVHRAICKKINEWYDDGSRNAQVRTILWEEICNSFVLFKGHVIQQGHSQPSGNPITVFLNSIYNSMAMRFCWLVCEKVAFESGFIDKTEGLIGYHKHVVFNNYGDDNIGGIDDYAIRFFNQETITAAMRLLGLTYTDEAKTGEVKPFREISEVAFLKRSFVPSDIGVLAPLELQVCREMTLWTRGKDPSGNATLENVRNATMELALHGSEVYKEEVAKLDRAIRAAGLTYYCGTHASWMEFHEEQKKA